jgi:hypothetical protein
MLARPAIYLSGWASGVTNGVENPQMLECEAEQKRAPGRERRQFESTREGMRGVSPTNAAADAMRDTPATEMQPPSPFNQAYPHSGLENRT